MERGHITQSPGTAFGGSFRLYLGKATVGSFYGVAGSVIVLIVWVHTLRSLFFSKPSLCVPMRKTAWLLPTKTRTRQTQCSGLTGGRNEHEFSLMLDPVRT
jgi:uncharacterized BrkB/YihY/UPF0761 family membrane protein